MRLPIRQRIVLFPLGPITLIYVIVFAVAVMQMQQRARLDIERYMGELAMHYATQFDAHFRENLSGIKPQRLPPGGIGHRCCREKADHSVRTHSRDHVYPVPHNRRYSIILMIDR